jgi:hypothetical protein
LWLIQPKVLHWLAAHQEHKRIDNFAWFLLFLPLLEIFGIFLKQPVSSYFRNRMSPVTEANHSILFLFILSLITHLTLACMYLLASVQWIPSVSIVGNAGSLTWLVPVLLFIVIAKEGFLIGVVLSTVSIPEMNQIMTSKYDLWLINLVNGRPLARINILAFFKDLLGDLCLLVFSAITYTIMWDFMLKSGRYSHDLMEILGLLIYFMILYLPLRILSLAFDVSIPHTKRETNWMLASIFLLAGTSVLFFYLQ